MRVEEGNNKYYLRVLPYTTESTTVSCRIRSRQMNGEKIGDTSLWNFTIKRRGGNYMVRDPKVLFIDHAHMKINTKFLLSSNFEPTIL